MTKTNTLGIQKTNVHCRVENTLTVLFYNRWLTISLCPPNLPHLFNASDSYPTQFFICLVVSFLSVLLTVHYS